MLTINYITVFVIVFFLLYNSIGENKSLTHSKLIALKTSLDKVIVKAIERLKSTPYSQIDDNLYRLVRFAPFILLIFAAAIIQFLPPSIYVLGVTIFSIFLIGVALFGFVNRKRAIQSTKEFLNNALFFIVMTLILVIIILFESGKAGLIEAYHMFLNTAFAEQGITDIAVSDMSALLLVGTILILVSYVFLWVFYRALTKFSIIAFIAFAKFCYLLNKKSPLRSFYLIFQILFTLVSELLINALK